MSLGRGPLCASWSWDGGRAGWAQARSPDGHGPSPGALSLSGPSPSLSRWLVPGDPKLWGRPMLCGVLAPGRCRQHVLRRVYVPALSPAPSGSPWPGACFGTQLHRPAASMLCFQCCLVSAEAALRLLLPGALSSCRQQTLKPRHSVTSGPVPSRGARIREIPHAAPLTLHVEQSPSLLDLKGPSEPRT